MKNINNKFQEEYEHRGFSDIMVYSNDYPKGCFDPREYFDASTGHFKFHNGPIPTLPKIAILEKANEKYFSRNKGRQPKDQEVHIDLRIKNQKEEEMNLVQCPICKHMTTSKHYKIHVKACLDKEKKEKEKEKEKK